MTGATTNNDNQSSFTKKNHSFRQSTLSQTYESESESVVALGKSVGLESWLMIETRWFVTMGQRDVL